MAKTQKKSLKGAGSAGSMKDMKKDLKRGGGGSYLTFIPADGITVRFMDEPHEWFKYFEHYDPEVKKSFPCTEDCKGCDEGLDRRKRYLVNVVDTTENKVIQLVIPPSLVQSLTKKYDKFGTILDRDYELSKEGTGMDTSYSDLYEQPSKIKMSRYEGDKKDCEEILLKIVEAMEDDEEDDDDDEDEKPSKKSKAKSKPDSKPAKGGKSKTDEKKPPSKSMSKSKDTGKSAKGKSMKKSKK